MGLENRLNKIQNTNDAIALEESEVAIRIDNKMLNASNSNPFNISETKQTRSLINGQLNLFYNIILEKDGADYKITINYGSVGAKCKIPIVGRYSSASLAVNECNAKMREKLSKGYVIK
jgi:predicted DNA-binding WGR domain protein